MLDFITKAIRYPEAKLHLVLVALTYSQFVLSIFTQLIVVQLPTSDARILKPLPMLLCVLQTAVFKVSQH
jgi:hypothetical protein